MQISNLRGDGGIIPSFTSSASSNNSLGGVLGGLITAIKLGDQGIAQKYLGRLQKISDNLVPENAIGRLVSDAGQALARGDMSAARQAVATFQAKASTVTPSAGAAASANVTSTVGSDSDSSMLNTVAGDVANLLNAIGSGDLMAARAVFNTLKSLVAKHTAAVNPDPVASKIAGVLAEVGTALESGNGDAARRSLRGLLGGFAAGSIVDTNA